MRRSVIEIHEMSQELLIKRSPIRTDANSLIMFGSKLNNCAKLLVFFIFEPNVAWINAIFCKRLGAGGMICEQFMANVMEIAHKRRMNALLIELVANMRHGGCSFVSIDCDSNNLRTRLS